MIRTFSAVVVLVLASVMLPAYGQALDQTNLEQMFGEPVTTSATGKPQRASDVPAEMDIITADDIRRSGSNNIPDILRFVPGLDVRRYGMTDVAVGIRGYNTALNPRVLVLLDGRQVYQDDYGATNWSLIPVTLSEIRQIEIIKGPAAALYGFNAVSGVINIVTFDPLRDKVNAVRVDGGTQSQTYGEVTSTVQIPGQLGMRISANGFRSREFPGTNADSSGTGPRTGIVATDIRIQLAPAIELDLAGSLGSYDGNIFLDPGIYANVGLKANSLRSRLSADTSIGLLQFDAYRNENRTSDGLFLETWRQDVTVVQASDLVKLGTDHTLRFATEYRNNAVASLLGFSGRVGYTNYAASAMWTWQATPSLNFTNAVRIDHLSLSHDGAQFNVPTVGALFHAATITEPSFNSGAVLKLSPNDTVRLTAARAVQLPSLLDFGFARTFDNVTVAGNNGLRPSAVLNYEMDYDRALPFINSTIRASIFSQRTDRSIGLPFGSGVTLLPSGQILMMAQNFGGSSEVGGEIGIKGSQASGLRWNISYALALVHEDNSVVAPPVGSRRQTPTHTIIAGLGYTLGKLEFDTQVRWQSQIEDYTINPQTLVAQPALVPNYVTVHARVGYPLTEHITTSIVAEQLNQQHLTQTGGLQVERRFIASLKAQF